MMGRGLLLKGDILLIKKTFLVSVSEGSLLCGMGSGRWTDYEDVSQ